MKRQRIPERRDGPLETDVEAWRRDTRCLSLEERGAWWDILTWLHEAPQRGILTLPIEDWAEKLGVGIPCAKAVIKVLIQKNVADDHIVIEASHGQSNAVSNAVSNASKRGRVTLQIDGQVTLACRRMLREERARIAAAERQARFRRNAESNAAKSGKSNASKCW